LNQNGEVNKQRRALLGQQLTNPNNPHWRRFATMALVPPPLRASWATLATLRLQPFPDSLGGPAALDRLRAALFPEDESKEEGETSSGAVALGERYRADVVLARFLRGKSGDVDAAAEQIREDDRWRREGNLDTLCEDFPRQFAYFDLVQAYWPRFVCFCLEILCLVCDLCDL
jgi:hypothetical protein